MPALAPLAADPLDRLLPETRVWASADLAPSGDQDSPSLAALLHLAEACAYDDVASGSPVYVNGDPVNLVDPDGHKSCAFDSGPCGEWSYKGQTGCEGCSGAVQGYRAQYARDEAYLARCNDACLRQAAQDRERQLHPQPRCSWSPMDWGGCAQRGEEWVGQEWDHAQRDIGSAWNESTTFVRDNYDANMQITQQSFGGPGANSLPANSETQNFGYDAANRVVCFNKNAACNPAAPNIQWDHNSNRLTAPSAQGVNQTYVYNADNTIASANSVPYGYSNAGQLVRDEKSTYCYDGFDRLSKVAGVGSANPCTDAAPAEIYAYDGLDRQVSHSEGPAVTKLHYDGNSQQVVTETGPTGDLTYELGPRGNAMALKGPAVGTQILNDDGHGNVATVTDLSANPQCTVRYDAFGSPEALTGAGNPCNTGSTPNHIFYRSGRQDSTTGNYQLGSRTYDPAKAAFLTPDSYRATDSGKNLSVGVDPMTQNRYAYVNGDPVNLADPTGHRPSCGDSSDQTGGCPWPGHDSGGGGKAAGPGLQRKYSDASGADLVKDCLNNLDCGVGDFEAMTIQQRRLWAAYFQAKYGRNKNLPFNGWFNNVLGTLHAFQDQGLVTPGSWLSISDAATLEGIQSGFHAFSSGADPGSNPGAAKWKGFFEQISKDPTNTQAIARAWGQAEKASVHYGADVADQNVARPKWATQFVRIGDEYRDALGGSDASAFVADSARVYGRSACGFNCAGIGVFGVSIASVAGMLPNDALLDPRFDEEFIHGSVNALLKDLQQQQQ